MQGTLPVMFMIGFRMSLDVVKNYRKTLRKVFDLILEQDRTNGCS